MKLETITRTPKTQTHATPLLFVHGMWHGAWCWDEYFLPFFAENGYLSTALSLRGHAGSEGSIRGSNIADYVSDVEQVAKPFETHPVLIGHSMGGFIVQKYLETRNAPAGILFSSSPPSGLWHSTILVFMHNPLALLKATAQWRLYPVVEKTEQARWALFSKDIPEEKLMKYHAKLNDESYRAYLDMLGLNLVNPKRVKSPLLILGGEDDAVIPPGDAHKTARAYGLKAEIIPNIAHDMMIDTGWKSAAEKILSWLKEKGI